MMRAFIMLDISIEIFALNIQRCIIATSIMVDVFIGILIQYLRRCALGYL